jgi:hypothetical protein
MTDATTLDNGTTTLVPNIAEAVGLDSVKLAEFGCIEEKPRTFEALPKEALLKALEAKAKALLGMANASQIGDEREGLKFQAYAIRQAVRLLEIYVP